MAEEDTANLLHELRVHQAELEVQNEELRRTQVELDATRARYFNFYDLAPVGYLTLNEKGVILEANLAAATLLGVARGALVKQPISRFILNENQDIYYLHHKQLFQSGEPQACEQRMVKQDGTSFWAYLEATSALDADGAHVCRVVLYDITERKHAEEALRESENRYESLVSNIPDIIFTIDLEGKITFINPRVKEILGYESAETINRSILNFIPEEDRKRAMESLQKGMTGEKVTHFQTPMIKKSGERLFLECSFSRVYKNGALIGAQGTAVDITARKLAEGKLALNSERVQALLQLNQMTQASLQEITDFALEHAVRLTQSTIGYLAFLNEDESVLTMHAWSKSAMAECAITDKPIVYPVVTTGLWGEAVRQRRAVIINDYTADNPLKKGYPHGHVAVKRHMNTPVFEGSRIVIVAGVGNKAGEYDQSDIQQLTLLMEGMWRLLENKRAEEALRLSEARFKSLVETQSDLIARSDLNGRLTFVNDAYCRTFGKAREELLGKIFTLTISPEDKPTVTAMIKAVQSPPHHMQTETRHPTPSGIRWFSWDNAAVLDESGKVQELQGIGRDTTDRKQAEAALKKSEDQYRKAQEVGRIGHWEFDPISCYFSGSPEAFRVYGFPDNTPVPFDDIANCISKVEVGRVVQALFGLIQDGKEFNEEFEICPRNSSEARVLWSMAWVQKDEHGNPSFVSGILQDITERKKAEEEIRKLNAELEQRVIDRTSQLEIVNKELEAFSYSVSHDLRAPLRSIDGFSQALVEDYPDKLDEQGKDYLQRIRSNTQRMGELIDDLLKLSRVTRSEMKLETVNLSALAQSIAAEAQKTQPERRVEFVITPGLNASGDANLLRLVLENLLGNAWKFTGKHSLARIEFGSTQVDGKQVFFVRDNGAGFDMTYADKLFVPFQRLHSASEFTGIGIGLATVQRIVHRHGGRVWAEGEMEKGATFYFTLAATQHYEGGIT